MIAALFNRVSSHSLLLPLLLLLHCGLLIIGNWRAKGSIEYTAF
jgi:hypothetical protein